MEAALPVQRTDHQLLRDLIIAQDVFVHPPKIIIANGIALDDNKNYAVRVLQNCGTAAVYWKVGGAGTTVSVDSFHGILKAGTAVDDGTGGVVDLSRIRGGVYILAATGNPRVATFQCTAPEGASQAAKP